MAYKGDLKLISCSIGRKASSKMLTILLSLLACAPLQATRAGDPGIPDSVKLGNLDGSHLKAVPGDTVLIPVWIKCDEDILGMAVRMSVDPEILLFEFLGGVAYSVLDVGQAASFGCVQFTEQEIYFFKDWRTFTMVAYAETDHPYAADPFNTKGKWIKAADFVFVVTPDSSLIGVSTEIVLSEDPVFGQPFFFGKCIEQSWKPAYVNGFLDVVSTSSRTNRGISPRISWFHPSRYDDRGQRDELRFGSSDSCYILADPGDTLMLPIWVRADQDVFSLSIRLSASYPFATGFWLSKRFGVLDTANASEWGCLSSPGIEYVEAKDRYPIPFLDCSSAYSSSYPRLALNTAGQWQQLAELAVVVSKDLNHVGEIFTMGLDTDHSGFSAGPCQPAWPPQCSSCMIEMMLSEFGPGKVKHISVNENGSIKFITGDLLVGITTDDSLEQCYQFFENHRALFSIADPRSELIPDPEANMFIRLQQRYKGVEVLYGWYDVVFDSLSRIVNIGGQFFPEVYQIPTTIPKITREKAITLSLEHYRANPPEDFNQWAAEYRDAVTTNLLLTDEVEGKFVLAWEISHTVFWASLVDAATGEVLKFWPHAVR